MRVGLFAAREPARGAYSVVSVCVWDARCCAVFVAVIFCCYRGCVPGWLRGARFLASLTVRVVFTYAFPCE